MSETIDISELTPDAANVRERTERSAEVIANSLKQFGAGRSIVLDRNGVVRAGNGTVEGAKVAGIDRVRVIESDGSELIAIKRTDLDGAEATAYAIADNRAADLSTWNFGDLDAQLEALADAEFDIDSIGFSEDELAALFDDPAISDDEPATTDDGPAAETNRADELAEQWKTSQGQLWEIKGEQTHRLVCGDSTQQRDVTTLFAGKSADMVFTDPPYGVAYQGGHNERKRKKIEGDSLHGEDLTQLFVASLANAVQVSEDTAAFYVWFASGKSVEVFSMFAQLPLELRAVIQWYKVRSGLGAFMSQYIPNCEPCIYAHKKGQAPQWFGPTDEKTVWELQNGQRHEWHPTQKPTELAKRAIRNSSRAGEIVFDPFLGSGTTMLAAEQNNRKCYGVEISPAYVAVILQRMTDAGCECQLLES